MASNRDLFLRYVGQTSPEPMGLEIVRAEGCKLFDKKGKDYYDLVAGVSVSNLGHNNQAVVQAVKQQVERYMHLMVYGEFVEEPQVLLADLLNRVLPESLTTTFFTNSGSEAIEGAMKLAKRFTGRKILASFKRAYHGSTQGAMSLMSDEYYTAAFRPLLPGIRHLEFNNIDSLDLIDESVAAVIVEPVRGEAGVEVPENNFLARLQERCKQVGALLVFDEIQSGFGRTGELFAFQKYGLVPDVLVTAKALGGGMPLGALTSSHEIMNSFTSRPVLGHITTFGGHPVSAAAGLASLQYLLDNPHLMQQVSHKEELFVSGLKNAPHVKEIRSSGLLMAVDLGSRDILFKVFRFLQKNGIHTDWFLFDDHSFRISPPLIIQDAEIQEIIERIWFSLKEL